MIQKIFVSKGLRTCLIFVLGYIIICCNQHDTIDSREAVILEYQNRAKMNNSRIRIDSLVMMDEEKINRLEYDSMHIEEAERFAALCKRTIKLHTRALNYKLKKSNFAFQNYSNSGFVDYSAEVEKHKAEIKLLEKKIRQIERDILDLRISTRYELDTLKDLKILTYYLEAVIDEKNIADTLQMIFNKGYKKGIAFDDIFYKYR